MVVRYIYVYISIILISCNTNISNSEDDENNTTIKLIITDSIGVDFGDLGYVFGNVVDVAQLQNSNQVFLDPVNGTFAIFSQSNEFIESHHFVGVGPGEYQEPSSVCSSPNGTIHVVDFSSSKIIRYNADFEYLDEITGFDPLPPVFIDGFTNSDFVGLQVTYTIEGETLYTGYRVASWSNTAEPTTVFMSQLERYDTGGLTNILFAATFDGIVYCSPLSYDTYNIVAYNENGDTLFSILQEFELTEKTSEELYNEHPGYVIPTPGFDSDDRIAFYESWEPDQYRYAISGLYTDGLDRLWVRTGKGDNEGIIFDVYDRNGEFICNVCPDLPVGARYWEMKFWDDVAVLFDTNPSDFSKVYILSIQ